MAQADLYDLFALPEDEARVRAQALTQALRRQQGMGGLGLLTGDKVLGALGQQQLGEAQRTQQMLAQAGQQAYGTREQGARDAAALRQLQSRQAAQQQEAARKAEQEATKQGLEIAEGLRKEVMGNPVTRSYLEATVAFDKVQRAAKDPSAAGDLALIFGVMKTLDPGSTVREGEFASAQNAAGVPQRVLNVYNRVLSGERLSPEQRTDFVRTATGQYAAQKQAFERLVSGYKPIAQRAGVDVRDVLPLPADMGVGGAAPAAAPWTAPAAGVASAGAPAATPGVPAAPSADVAIIRTPDGRTMQVPRANLAKALEMGAVEVR